MSRSLEEAAEHLKHGRIQQAEQICVEILAQDPNQVPASIILGRIHAATGRADSAIEHYKRALIQQPAAGGFVQLAELQLRNRRHSGAIESAQSAIRLDPKMGVAHELMGIALEESGNFPGAIAEFERAFELQPEKTSILYRIVRSKRITEHDREFIAKLEQLLNSAHSKPDQKRYLCYALGKAYDDLGEFENAIRAFDEANTLSERVQFAGKRYPAAEFKATFDLVKKTYSASFFQSHRRMGSDSERPVFIVGMPRSGTTLLEQILSSHPNVAGGGELPFWLAEPSARLQRSIAAGNLNTSAIRDMQQSYLLTLSAISADAARVTDKMPNNYMALGFAHLLFPKARIIHCRRNPVDNCLSIYSTVYSDPPKYAYSRENIVTAYQLYADLMAHWQRVIPSDRFLNVDYEDLIADRDAVTRRMIEFCGLEWNDACLHHDQNTRAVNTPSLWQVRQPIYKSSVERWRNYQPWLGAFQRLL